MTSEEYDAWLKTDDGKARDAWYKTRFPPMDALCSCGHSCAQHDGNGNECFAGMVNDPPCPCSLYDGPGAEKYQALAETDALSESGEWRRDWARICAAKAARSAPKAP